jgi:AcrR family transcriptional regulator
VDKIEAILNEACILFAEKGYEHTPISEIAENAGVASGTIIYHFKNKDNLLYVLVWQTLNALFRQTRGRLDQVETGIHGVELFIDSFFDFMRTHRNESMLLLKNRSFEKLNDLKGSPAMDIKSIQRRYSELLEEVLQNGIEDKTVKTMEVRPTAMNITAMLVGSAWLILFFDESVDVLNKAALDNVKRALTP